MTSHGPDAPDPIHLDFHLLDRQIVDSGGRLVGKVDDLELTVDAGGVPTVVALLAGQRVLGERMGGLLGSLVAAAARRLGAGDPVRIPYDQVATVGSDVTLSVSVDQLAEPRLEAWLRDHVVGKMPGADRGGSGS